MAINRIDYVTSITASTAPTPGTPSASSDVLTKGYADSYLSNKSSWYDKQSTITDIKGISSANRSNGQIVFNIATAVFYAFSSGSSATGDDDTVLTPTSGTGRWIKITGGAGGSGNSLVQELDGQDSGILAGESIADRAAVCLELHNGTGSDVYRIFNCDADLPTRRSFAGFSKSAVSGTTQVKTYTIDAAFVSGNVVPITINGRSYSTTYASSSDATLQALATLIATDQDVKTAAVTVVGGNQTGTDDRVIVITASNGQNGGNNGYISLNISGTTVTGGASQPGVTIATQTAVAANAVDIHAYGPLGSFSGLTAGMLYYLSGTAGAITATPTDGNPVCVGRAINSTYLFVDSTKGQFVNNWGNSQVFVRSHGQGTIALPSTGQQDSEHFNFTAWSTGVSSTGGARTGTQVGGQGEYNSNHHVVDGVNTSSSVAALHQSYNKASWSTQTNRGTARTNGISIGNFAGLLYVNNGSIDTSAANATNNADAWNTSSWSAKTAWGTAVWRNLGFIQNSLMRSISGNNTSDSNVTTHQTRTTADSVSTSTVIPSGSNNATSCQSGASMANGLAGNVNSAGTGSGSYEWNGSWSSSITNQYSRQGAAAAGNSSTSLSILNGGDNGSAVQLTTEKYNGSTFSTTTASTNGRGFAKASNI